MTGEAQLTKHLAPFFSTLVILGSEHAQETVITVGDFYHLCFSRGVHQRKLQRIPSHAILLKDIRSLQVHMAHKSRITSVSVTGNRIPKPIKELGDNSRNHETKKSRRSATSFKQHVARSISTWRPQASNQETNLRIQPSEENKC